MAITAHVHSNSPGARNISWPDRQGWIALILFLLILGALYGATLDNGLAPGDLEGGDLITHQYAQVQARPSNAPGYPLYTMGGWLWFHAWRHLLPQANPIAILSSYSTLWALLALATLYLLLWRATRGNLILTLGLSAFYGVTYFFWYYAVSTEQYASAVFQTLLILLVLLQWDNEERDHWLYVLALLLGLSLAHMVTVLFIAPGVLAFILMKRPDLLKQGKLILGSLLLALTPLSAYVYVYVRGAAHPEWWGEGHWENAWTWFLSFLSTQQGRDELTWSLLPWNPEQVGLFVGELGLLVLALGGIGWWLWGRRHFMLFVLTAGIYFIFSYIDRFGNWYQVIMPLYPLIVVGAGVSLGALWERLPQRRGRVALSLLLVGMVGFQFVKVYPQADQRDRPQDTGLDSGWSIMAQDPPPHAAIVGDEQEELALDYLTGVWGVRSDVTVISTRDIAWALAQGRPVLVTVHAVGYAAAESGLPLRYTAWGPTLLLAGKEDLPQLPLERMSWVAADVGDGLKLVGYQVLTGGAAPWWVRLALQAESTPSQDWAISVRLLAEGQEIAQEDHPAPALGFTPTTSLHPGEIVFDAFAFSPPTDAPSPDALRIIFYRQQRDGGFENLAVLDFPITRVISKEDRP